MILSFKMAEWVWNRWEKCIICSASTELDFRYTLRSGEGWETQSQCVEERIPNSKEISKQMIHVEGKHLRRTDLLQGFQYNANTDISMLVAWMHVRRDEHALEDISRSGFSEHQFNFTKNVQKRLFYCTRECHKCKNGNASGVAVWLKGFVALSKQT